MRNFAVMREDRVGNAREFPPRRRVLVEDRLAAEIRARHDPEVARREQEEVHGRIGEHHAEVRVPRRDGRRDAAVGIPRAIRSIRRIPPMPPQEDDGRDGRCEQPLLVRRYFAQLPHGLR